MSTRGRSPGPPASHRGPRRARGFTLLELLVGLTVFALLSSLAYAGLSLAGRTFSAGASRIDATDTVRLVQGFLRRELEGAVPLAVVERNAWHLWFEGDRGGAVWLAEVPAYIGTGGIHRVRIGLADAQDGRALVLERASLTQTMSDAGDAAGERRTLAEGVTELELAYFGVVDDERSPSWHDEWRRARRLPALVRIDITTRDAGRWPPLIVNPRTDAVRFERALETREDGSVVRARRLTDTESEDAFPEVELEEEEPADAAARSSPAGLPTLGGAASR
ncbi:MAG: prepilin-type N-terminal cleavage/methylation domain-containing protein [Chromatiales bacterium]|nr:prepilin-type N-terminal cleavage/methylation domain-containing protein [Chromatiales bacterium]